MKIDILKCQGSGNDFILIDEFTGANTAILESCRPLLARTLCDRKNGIGADGLLFCLQSDAADCRMRMFNPDGSEAEMCGNGLRCVGRYCAEMTNKGHVSVETMEAILAVRREERLFDGIETFEAEIGPVSLATRSLPMKTECEDFVNGKLPGISEDFEFTALSVPNPHLVAIVADIDETTVAACGYAANDSEVFPRGVNVSFLAPLGDNRIYVVTYERGVGITYSCGTAMSASAYVSVLNGITDGRYPIQVFNNGGMVVCDVPNEAELILLKGNATFVFEASIQVTPDLRAIEKPFREEVRLVEIDAYEKLREHAQRIITVEASARRPPR